MIATSMLSCTSESLQRHLHWTTCISHLHLTGSRWAFCETAGGSVPRKSVRSHRGPPAVQVKGSPRPMGGPNHRASLTDFLSSRPTIILGSASRGRRDIVRELAQQYNFQVEQTKADIDEQALGDRSADPTALVLLLAMAKADAIQKNLDRQSGLLVTCDQVVTCNGSILEKPQNASEARQFISGYSSHPACTVSSVMVTNLANGASQAGVDTTKTTFYPIPEDVIEKLIEEGFIYQCAGGLMIEHPLVAPLVKSLRGTVDSVQGLPKALLLDLISKVI